MNTITQQEYDNLPVINGFRQCPGNTDYANVTNFGNDANFGNYAKFGYDAKFGYGAQFGDGAKFGNDAILNGSTIFSASGFGSQGRYLLGVPTLDGVYIECGCWRGMLPEFRARVTEVYGVDHEYHLLADAFEARWKRIVS